MKVACKVEAVTELATPVSKALFYPIDGGLVDFATASRRARFLLCTWVDTDVGFPQTLWGLVSQASFPRKVHNNLPSPPAL